MLGPADIARLSAAAFGVAAVVSPWKIESCGVEHIRVALYHRLDDVFTPSTNEPMSTGMCVLGILVLQVVAHMTFTRATKRLVILLLMLGWGSLTTGIHGLMSPKCPGTQLQAGPFFAYSSIAATSYSLWASDFNQ